MKCYHRVIISGGGMYDDALTCKKCGMSTYPENLTWVTRMFIGFGICRVYDSYGSRLYPSDPLGLVYKKRRRKKTPDKDKGEDNDLLPKIEGKVILVKEFSPMHEIPTDVLTELRGIYDGENKKKGKKE